MQHFGNLSPHFYFFL